VTVATSVGQLMCPLVGWDWLSGASASGSDYLSASARRSRQRVQRGGQMAFRKVGVFEMLRLSLPERGSMRWSGYRRWTARRSAVTSPLPEQLGLVRDGRRRGWARRASRRFRLACSDAGRQP
jgi:hypothetical protein